MQPALERQLRSAGGRRRAIAGGACQTGATPAIWSIQSMRLLLIASASACTVKVPLMASLLLRLMSRIARSVAIAFRLQPVFQCVQPEGVRHVDAATCDGRTRPRAEL